MSVAELKHWDDLAVRVIRELLPFGVLPARDDEVAEGRALAAELIGGTIVSEADFRRVHRRCGMALFLAHEDSRLTGMLAMVPLTAAGDQAVWKGSFQALAPADAHVARRGQEVRGIYGWGVAGGTRESAKRLVEASRVLREGVLAHLPNYARPVTPSGDRFMREKLGFVDLPGSKSGLVWTPAIIGKAAAA
jgi:hypothetical protein